VIDPPLTFFNSSSVKIGENNDWAGTAELTATFTGVGAFGPPRHLQKRRPRRHARAR